MALKFQGGKATERPNAAKAKALHGAQYYGRINELLSGIRAILDGDRGPLNLTPSMHGKLVEARSALGAVQDEILGMQGGNG